MIINKDYKSIGETNLFNNKNMIKERREIEQENDLDSQVQNQEEEEEEIEDEEDKKEMKIFSIELLIYTKVMDNREEIKKCICHNYLFLDDEEKDKNDEQNLNLNEQENIYIEKEIIPNLEIPIIRESNGIHFLENLNNIESPDKFYIKLNDLTKSLQKLGFPLSGSMINIFINYSNKYVYFGTEPLDNKSILYSYMLEPNKDVIKMKIINYIQKRMLDGYSNSIINTYFRKPIKKVLPSLEVKTKIFTPSMTNLEYYADGSDSGEESSFSSSNVSYNNNNNNNKDDNYNIDKNGENKKKLKFGKMSDSQKRERKIGYIIEKVYAWRKLYNGYKDERNNYFKYSLDNAAEKINVSKKSLDDYLLQIRLGRKYGFNFNENKYKKIGELRDFVKDIKERETGIVKKREQKGKKLDGNNKNKNTKIDKNKVNKKEKDNKEDKPNEKIIPFNSLFAGLDLNLDNEEDKKKQKKFIGKKRK